MLAKINVRNLLISLDRHRRTVLDCLAILMIIGGVVALGLALGLLYPTDEHPRLPGTDVIAVGSTAAAVGGILLGIGGNRDDHEVNKKTRDEQEKARRSR